MNKERTILYLFSINAIIYIASGFIPLFYLLIMHRKELMLRR